MKAMSFFFLFFGILVFMTSSTFLSFWLSLTFSLLATLSFLSSFKKELALKYILIQELTTWGFLVGLLTSNYMFLNLSLMMKLGMPPFHSWFLELLEKNLQSSSWLLGPSKIIPGSLMIFFFLQTFYLFIFLSFFFSMLLLGGGSGFFPLLIYSSSTNTMFFLGLCGVSFFSSFFYFYLYSFFLFFAFFLHSGKKESSWESMMILSGLPPGFIFFLKILSLFSSGEWFSLMFVLVLMSSLPLFFSYLQVWEKNSGLKSFFYFGFQQESNYVYHFCFLVVIFFFIFSY